MRRTLRIVSGPSAGRLLPISDAEVSIGRHPSNVLAVDDLAVSRRHCVIRANGQSVSIEDLQSANGTVLNGAHVSRAELNHGDEICVGSCVVRYETREETDSVPVLPDKTVRLPLEELELLAEKSRGDDAVLRAERDLRAVVRCVSALQPGERVDPLGKRLFDVLLSVVPADSASLVVVDPENDELHVACRSDREGGRESKAALSRTLVRRALAEAAGFAIDDTRDLEADPGPKSVATSGAHSVLVVPLIAHGRRAGAIYLDAKRAAAFDAGHLELLSAVAVSVAGAVETARHDEWLERELRDSVRRDFEMVGDSPAIEEVLRVIGKVAPTDATVLVLGESGTGKELAARAIHRYSRRAAQPFVAVNCAALTESLLEAELFGYEKGAFTGANALKKGKFEVADGGTIFLDEAGELSAAAQGKLLRVLQNRELERVGGHRTIPVDVRVIAATNRDLKKEVAENRFREDLYFRLNVVSMTMPPLRERADDIALLVNHFVAQFSERMALAPVSVSAEALRLLRQYDWPGNVRELENAIERAVVLHSGPAILPEDLPESLLDQQPPAESTVSDYHSAVREFKEQLIIRELMKANGSYTNAAKRLGIHPNNLHRIVRNMGLRPKIEQSLTAHK